jgi:hypothetical protein
MDKAVKEKIDKLIEMARNTPPRPLKQEKPMETALSRVIKTQEEADLFMLRLKALG